MVIINIPNPNEINPPNHVEKLLVISPIFPFSYSIDLLSPVKSIKEYLINVSALFNIFKEDEIKIEINAIIAIFTIIFHQNNQIFALI